MTDWKEVRLGDVLTESKIESTSPNIESRIRVLLNARGVIKRPIKKETKGATKYFTRKKGQFIYGKQNIHKGAFGIVPDELDHFESTSDLPAFDVCEDCLPVWIDYYLKQGDFYLSLVQIARGAATKRVQPKELLELKIPLPSIEVQKEVVEHFKSIETEHDELKSELTHQQTLLKKLRQQILQEAIEGKLTADWRAQNPDIEPASELLARIQAEKVQLIKDKKIKKQKPLPPISEEEKPFALPDGWVWCRLGEIGNAINYPFVDGPFGSAINTKTDYVTSGVPVLRMMNVKPFRFISKSLKYVKEDKYQQFTRHNVLSGDVLFSKVGAGVGESCIVPRGFSYGMLSTTGITRMRVGQIVINQYLCNFLNLNIKNFMKLARKSLQPFLNMTQIKTFLIPLPPTPRTKSHRHQSKKTTHPVRPTRNPNHRQPISR